MIKKLAFIFAASAALSACKQGDLPPESRCTMYWDYYYNAGLGKSEAERQTARGVQFDDIRAIITADPSETTRVCQRILNDAFPGDPALANVTGEIPAAR